MDTGSHHATDKAWKKDSYGVRRLAAANRRDGRKHMGNDKLSGSVRSNAYSLAFFSIFCSLLSLLINFIFVSLPNGYD